ncbi:transglycosylase SLT domain-containing protein, partial [Acinetobacter baumannii]
NASKFGFADLESKYKLPSGTLSAIHMIESRGNAKAYNKETGATGGFQFLEGTAKQYGVKDRTDLAQSAEGAAKYMSYLLKLFKGDLEKAVRAYHAGEGNVMKGKGIGKNNDQYWKDYQSYMAGINGYSAGDISSKEFGSYLRDFAKTQEEIKQLQITYDSEAVARSKRREEEINKATLLGQMDLLPKIKERFDAEEKLAQKQFDFEVNGYKWTEEQKLDYTYETNSLRLVAEGKLSEDQRQVALDGLKLQKQQELGLLKLAQEQRLFQAEQFMLGEMERIKKRYALEYDEISKITDLEERRRKMSAFQADFIRNGVGNPTIDQYDTSSQFLKSTNYTKPKQTNMQVLDEDYAQTYQKLKDNLAAVLESEKASYQERLEAQRVFKEARQQMEDEYYLKAVDARKSDYENQLMQLGSLTSQLDSYWSNMTGIVKNAAGEQSGLYKGMYIAQQAFAISSATISALQAYNQILASPWYLDVISKSTAANLVLGMGMANVGLIAGQTIAGFSDGGFTGSGGKYEPAGIVHKGEVVWSQEDIRRWGGVGLVENMRKSANPEAFLNNKASADSVMRRAMMSSSAFIESQKQADIFNQPVQDTQIIYKGNRDTPKLASSANSDLFHDGKVYFSSNGLVQDRSNLEDVQDFTMGQAARPQAEMMPSIEPALPTINFKIEVINQVSGATVEAEQLDEQTVRIIVKDELDKQLPRTVPKLVSDQIANPNSTISRSLTENTTARRNR